MNKVFLYFQLFSLVWDFFQFSVILKREKNAKFLDSEVAERGTLEEGGKVRGWGKRLI
jgi:hypothetical protein